MPTFPLKGKMALNLSVADLWSDVVAVREHSPLVYSITNQSDMSVDEARKLLPPGVFIGSSVESMDEVLQSATLPVDYLGVSPHLCGQCP